METISLTPKRKAQLDLYAQRHGQDPVAALDDLLDAYLDWEERDYREAVEGIREGYADFNAGRTWPADQTFDELHEKHGLPRCDNRQSEAGFRRHPRMAACRGGG